MQFIYILLIAIIVYYFVSRLFENYSTQEDFDPSLVPVSSIVTLAKVAQKLVDGGGTLTNPGNLTVTGNLTVNGAVNLRINNFINDITGKPRYLLNINNTAAWGANMPSYDNFYYTATAPAPAGDVKPSQCHRFCKGDLATPADIVCGGITATGATTLNNDVICNSDKTLNCGTIITNNKPITCGTITATGDLTIGKKGEWGHTISVHGDCKARYYWNVDGGPVTCGYSNADPNGAPGLLVYGGITAGSDLKRNIGINGNSVTIGPQYSLPVGGNVDDSTLQVSTINSKSTQDTSGNWINWPLRLFSTTGTIYIGKDNGQNNLNVNGSATFAGGTSIDASGNLILGANAQIKFNNGSYFKAGPSCIVTNNDFVTQNTLLVGQEIYWKGKDTSSYLLRTWTNGDNNKYNRTSTPEFGFVDTNNPTGKYVMTQFNA